MIDPSRLSLCIFQQKDNIFIVWPILIRRMMKISHGLMKFR